MKKTFLSLALAAVALIGLGVGSAKAAMMNLHYTGYFGPTSSLNGTPFGADTPFTVDIQFDTANRIIVLDYAEFSIGIFPGVNASIAIEGFGIVTNDPSFNLNVELQTMNMGAGPYYLAGLAHMVDSHDNAFLSIFDSVSPNTFSALAPVPATMSGFIETGAPKLDIGDIPLANGAGILSIQDHGQEGSTATFTDVTAVPEPATWAMSLVVGLGGLLAYRRRR